MTRRPGSAVHVPPDCFEGVTERHIRLFAGPALRHTVDNMDSILRNYPDADAIRETRDAISTVAAMLRRLAPYLPSEAE